MTKVFLISLCALAIFASMPDCSASIIANIERYNSTLYNTPQIAGPLVEGALSYSDREFHCFKEIPQPLIGADYIKVVNNDKYTEFYTLDVTLSQAATLYLIIDHRIGHGWIGSTNQVLEPDLDTGNMSWVHDMGFVDTGWKMANDEDNDGFTNHHFSIYSKNAGPGTIRLYQQYDITNVGDRNMYSVAAVVPEPVTLGFLAIGSAFVIRKKRG